MLESISELYLDQDVELEEASKAARVILTEGLPHLSEVRLDEAIDLLETKTKKILEARDQEEDDGELDKLETTERDGLCQLCGANQRITIHHMVPKLVLKRMKKGKAKVGGQKKVDVSLYLVEVCRPCHNELHRLWGHGEMAKEYMTVDRLLEAPELQSYLTYKRKKEGNLVFT